MHIDIEIDEPYTPRQYPNGGPLKLTHCVGEDDDRDSSFKSRGWVVLRFSEQQVIQSSQGCCKEVARVVSALTGDASVMESFTRIEDVKKTVCWSEDEAKQMAARKARLTYT